MEYKKIKSVAKVVHTQGSELSKIVSDTMSLISEIVGNTLGPGGRQVLIERPEYSLPPMVTKDGVTVFRSLGFTDPTAHCIFEATRDVALRTASEAGDGPQPLWAKVLTPKGFVPMGELKVGMEICGTNGSIQKVVGVYPKGKKEIIKILFTEGRVVECCEDHLWAVTTNYGSNKILTTKEIMKNFRRNTSDGGGAARYYTPRTEVDFKEQPLPLDPYLVGVLLGDGCFRDSGSIELSLGMAKEHILTKLNLPSGITINTTVCPEKHSLRVKIVGETPSGETIRNLIDRIGLRNKGSGDKFIPQIYLLSSKRNRLSLLQGLLDTDGYFNSRGRFEFSTISQQLAEDFVFLARSLGRSLNIKLHHRIKSENSYSDKPIYRICELKGDMYGTKILNMESTGQFTEMQCIKVSNPDNLYITDGFIVTHNTTTATILSESICRKINEYCKNNPKISPQRIYRMLEKTFIQTIAPLVQKSASRINFSEDGDQQMLLDVAKISANGDTELAKAVMECFRLTGDDGNVTIAEIPGPSHYEVEKINGFPIGMGYEDSCEKFYPKFINDVANQKVLLEKPIFLIYHGRINEFQSLLRLLDLVYQDWQSKGKSHNIVIVATGFSESVMTSLAFNFPEPNTLNVFPLKAPQTPFPNGQLYFLQDLAAITGANILDPLNAPIENAVPEDLGPGVAYFEANRFRSNVVGQSATPEGATLQEDAKLIRVDELTVQLQAAESLLEKSYIEERIGKITGGIARLKVIGVSNGELKEKRDRAEDAVCAVRGAIKHGCLPGGGWTLMRIISELRKENNDILNKILVPALFEPVRRLFRNSGVGEEEMDEILAPIWTDVGLDEPKGLVYDILEGKHVDPIQGGILDSTPAVLEAVRNSIGIASLIGTLGGTIVHPRDNEFERREAGEAADYDRNSNFNPANERP
jgi:chaperonin GroEL (HSP60 family)